MAWKCLSQIQSHQITVKASPARQQIPVLTAPGIKAKHRGGTWHKGWTWYREMGLQTECKQLAQEKCRMRANPGWQGERKQPGPDTWDSTRSHTGWGDLGHSGRLRQILPEVKKKLILSQTDLAGRDRRGEEA